MITDQLRVNQGPLARVWLASHWERKISKSQFLQTNLEKSIDAITSQEGEPIALRVSGQLLLGVVRIYSRKTKYLLEDCNEALVKIKLAFKKGDINMPNINHTLSNNNAITMQDKLTEFDILLPDLPFNASGPSDERDPILDSLGDISMSQDITLYDDPANYSFNYELARGDNEGVERGRRDNEAALADNGFDMDAIADPLKDMNLNDNNNGLGDNNVDFDFDLNDNIDYADDGMDNNDFPLADFNNDADASLDTLMQVGIVEDNANVFGIDDITASEPARRRRRLVVDKQTEISQEDLRRYTMDTSSIVTKDTNLSGVSKPKTTVNLTKPFGNAVGSELEDMFTGLSRKRRASAANGVLQREDGFGVPTPGRTDLNSAFHFDDDDVMPDYGDMADDNDFDRDAYDRFNMDGQSDDSFMNTQSFSNSARDTLQKIEEQSPSVVKFDDLATSTSKKSEAARLFYDVLLLSTKNKIKVKQSRPFGEIQMTACM